MTTTTDNRLLIVTLITALAESGGSTREGIAYAGLMGVCSLEQFQAAVYALAAGGCITKGPQFLITITDKGRELAKKLEAAIAAAKASKGGAS